MTDIVERLNDSLSAGYSELRKEAAEEIMRLRAKVDAMERQEPVAWAATDETKTVVEALGMNQSRRFDSPLFLAPGAQPVPSVPREAIEKMLTQLMDIAVSNGANSVSMPDEYVEVAAWLCGIPAQTAPSVPELLESLRCACNYIDKLGGCSRQYRAALAATETKPASSVPDGWVRAIDEALVTAHIGVANESDTYEQAKSKLDNLIGFHIVVATDPAVNGGYKLMPAEPTKEIYECFAAYDGSSYSNPFDFDDFREDYLAALNSTGLPVGAKLYALPGAQGEGNE